MSHLTDVSLESGAGAVAGVVAEQVGTGAAVQAGAGLALVDLLAAPGNMSHHYHTWSLYHTQRRGKMPISTS